MSLLPIYKNEVRRSKLFSIFEEAMLDQIFRHGRLVRYELGHTLFRKGDPADCFYIIRRGCAKLFLSAPNGSEKTLDLIRPGMALAEIPMFTEESPHHYCDCELLEECELFEFNSAQYLKLLQQSPVSTLPLMQTLGQKIQQQAAEIGHLTLADARHRLTRYIFSQIECANKHCCNSSAQGCESGKECTLQLPTAKSTIASLLSIQRETFSRLLGKMRAEEMITVHGNRIQVTDLKRLRESVVQ